MGHLQTGENTLKQGKTPSNRGGDTSKQGGDTSNQEKHLSIKGYLPIKCKSLQVVGVPGQGKAVESDGG